MGLSASKRAAARAAIDAQSALPRFLSVYELAALVRRHEKTIYEWSLHSPERLPQASQIAGRLLFDARDVEPWLAAQRSNVVLAPASAVQLPKRGPGRPKKAEQTVQREAGPQRTHQ